MAEPLRAGVYGRQSRGKQKSITEQIALGSADAEEQGWRVSATYQDGSSASRFARTARDAWPRVLADVDAAALDVLVLWESSRGDRTPESWFGLLSACRERGVLVRIVSAERIYNLAVPRDWKELASDGVDNAYESEKISQRVRRGQAGAAAAGRPSQGRCPYGYVRRYDERTGELLGQEIDPTTAPVVREIIQRAAKSVPISAIVDDLNARGVPTPGAQRWYRVRVRDLATNPAYVGKRVHNGVEYPADWPPLVEPGIFYAAARVLGDTGRVTTRPGAVRHLLSYLATTPCGGTLTAVRGRYKCLADGCVTIVQSPTDDLVTEVILRRLAKPDAYGALRQAGDDADRELVAARAEAAALRARLDEWRRSAAAGKTTPETMAVVEADLTQQIRRADRRADRAGIPPALRELLAPGADVRARWRQATVPARREVVRTLVTVTVGPATSPGSRTFEPERVDVGWIRPGGGLAAPDPAEGR